MHRPVVLGLLFVISVTRQVVAQREVADSVLSASTPRTNRGER
jgi:hypothetical protein